MVIFADNARHRMVFADNFSKALSLYFLDDRSVYVYFTKFHS